MTLRFWLAGLLPLVVGCAHFSIAGLPGVNRSLGSALRTFGGSIRLADAPQGASLRSFGGDIAVGRAGGALKATSFGGDIRLAAVEGDVRATAFGGDIVVTLAPRSSESPRRVTLRSFGGDVTLGVPDSLAMAVDLRLVYDRAHEGDYDIESDFALERHETRSYRRDWAHWFKPVKTVTARSATRGGSNRIRIRVEGGNVSLKRAEAR